MVASGVGEPAKSVLDFASGVGSSAKHVSVIAEGVRLRADGVRKQGDRGGEKANKLDNKQMLKTYGIMVLFNRGFCLVLLGFLLEDFGAKKKTQYMQGYKVNILHRQQSCALL